LEFVEGNSATAVCEKRKRRRKRRKRTRRRMEL
jgi:hypothetical protein